MLFPAQGLLEYLPKFSCAKVEVHYVHITECL
jgi:hypothetical protein